MKTRPRVPIARLVLAGIAAALATAPPLQAAQDEGGLVAANELRRTFVPPPQGFRQGNLQKTADIVVNYNPGSCPSGTTTPWSTEARQAFQYAVDIWASILNGPRTIEIDACWRNDLPATTLGRAGPADFERNFTGAPQSDTWYPVALANQLADGDLNGSTAEISANFNSSFDWYFGFDGAASNSEYDFVTVVLHEIGHGLGFTGSMNYDDGSGNAECNGTAGTGCFGAGTSDPFIYDRFTENGAGTALLAYSSPSITLGNQLTSDAVFFDGTSTNVLNGGTPAELYAPTTWDPGSSYSHLGEVFNSTDDALMTFSLGFAETIHHPGLVTLGMFVDMGWDVRNLSSVWVDGSYTGEEIGGPTNPFDTVGEGVKAVEPHGTVTIRAGSYAEQITVIRSMFLRSEGGSAVIGQ